MDKNIIKETMLSLEGATLQSAREKYFDYVADARLDRSKAIESDEQAQAVQHHGHIDLHRVGFRHANKTMA